MKIKLMLLFVLVLTLSNVNAQKVISVGECTSATLENVFTNAGFEVIVAQPDYMQILQDTLLQIKPFIDIDAENQWLIFNLSNGLKDEVIPAQAKELVLNINAQTNFIRASYDEGKNSVDFRYYFLTKGGFTEDGLLSALNIFDLAYVYAITTVDKDELFK